MASVSAEITAQAGQTSNRTRSNRETAPTSGDEFGMLVENNDAPDHRTTDERPATQGPTSSSTSAVASRQDTPARQIPDATTTPTQCVEATNSVATPAPDVNAAAAETTVEPTPSLASGDDAADGQTASDQQTITDAAIPIALFIGLQASAGAQAGSTIETSDSVAVTNPPVALPGETAALALARVAQDATSPDTARAPNAEQAAATSPDAEQPKPATPSVIASDTPGTNDALGTATELTSRIAVAAATVEADTTLQAAVVAPAEAARGHGRLIASAPIAPNPGQTNAASSANQQTLKLSREAAGKPADQDAKAPDVDSAGHRRASPDKTDDAIGSAPLLAIQDKPSTTPAAHATADTTALADITSAALPASTILHTNTNVQQLTAAATNPALAVPITGLAVEIAANAQIGRSRFEIRLDPPELGRIDVKLDVDRQGQVTSHIVVEKASTLDLLRRDAPQLERALQDAGLKTSDNGLQFSLRDQQSQADRRNHNEDGRNSQRLTITDDETVPRETAGRTYGRMLGLSGGIDMRV